MEDEATGVAEAGVTDADQGDSEETDADLNEMKDIILVSTGSAKLQVIRVLKQMLPLSISEINNLVSQMPVTLFEDISDEEAQSIASRLEDVGAEVDVVDHDNNEGGAQ